MSTSVENYIIYGLKFGEEFTKDFWQKDFRDEFEWEEEKPFTPLFLTDGMNGSYTYFGFIIQLSNRWDDSAEKEINLTGTKSEVISMFYKLYPESTITDEDIKMYYLPHWV